MNFEEDWEEDEVDEICSRVGCDDCPEEICGDYCAVICEEWEEEVE